MCSRDLQARFDLASLAKVNPTDIETALCRSALVGILTYAESEVQRLLASGEATAADLCFSLQVRGARVSGWGGVGGV